MDSAALRGKRIIGIISFMNAGGAQEAMLRLARQLRRRGHSMEVWFLYEVAPAFRQEPFTRTILDTDRPSPLGYLRCYLRLYRALRAEKPEAVIGFLPLGNVFGLSAAALAGIRTRIASQRSIGTTYGKVMRALDRVCGVRSVYSTIVCVSKAVEDSFGGYPAAYRRKTRVVHNGIEWQPSALSKAEARATLGLPKDIFLACALGRLSAQKNYAFMLEAIAATPGIILAIGGDGELRQELEAQAERLDISDRVTFLGSLKREQVRDLLRASDAFVQTSLFEGQSNAVLEAMHSGLALALGDIPEQRETIEDPRSGEIAGLLLPLDNIAAWRDALVRLRDDVSQRQSFGSAALAMVENRFGLAKMTDGFEEALGLHVGR